MRSAKKWLFSGLLIAAMAVSLGAGVIATSVPADAEAAPLGLMKSLLDDLLGIDKVSGFTLSSSVSGWHIIVPSDNSDTVPIPLGATVVGGTGEETVRFVGGNTIDGHMFSVVEGENFWSGDTFSGAYPFPHAGILDVSPVLNGTEFQVLSIYGLLNAVELLEGATLMYEESTEPLLFLLQEAPAPGQPDSLDMDGNGIPDTPFQDLPPLTTYATTMDTPAGVVKTVVMNLDTELPPKKNGGGSTLLITPDEHITVTVPDLDALQTAGLVPGGEAAVVIVRISESLNALIDDAASGWADLVMGNAPAPALTEGGKFVEISILYTYNGGLLYTELEDFGNTGLSVILSMSGLSLSDATRLWSYPTLVTDDLGNIILQNDPLVPADTTQWTLRDTALDGDTLTAELTSFSVFSPFDGALVLFSATPMGIFENTATDVVLSGIIPTDVDLGEIAAADRYVVYFDGQVAPFRSGPGGAAITAYDGRLPNEAYVTSPALPIGTYLVTIEDRLIPGNSSEDIITVNVVETPPLPGVDVDVLISGDGAVEVSPEPDRVDGLYTQGTVVTLSAAPLNPVTDVFLNWSGPDAGELLPDVDTEVVSLTLDSDKVVQANFSGIAYFLDVTVVGEGSVTLDPMPNLDGVYPDGTEVTLTATADFGSTFSHWGGVNSNELSATDTMVTSIVMDGDKDLMVTFDRFIAVTQVTPSESWLFGGIVATLHGIGLTEDTIVTFDDQEAEVLEVALDGTSMTVVVPPSLDDTTIPLVDVAVRVEDADTSMTLPQAFTYKRRSQDSGVSLTAFVLDAPASDAEVPFVIDNTVGTAGSLHLPGFDNLPVDTDMLYGLIRTVETGVTISETRIALDAANGGGIAPTGSAVPGALDVAVYFYMDTVVNPAAAEGTATLVPAEDDASDALPNLPRGEGAEGEPTIGDPIIIDIPALNALDYELLREGVSAWSVGSDLDYLTEVVTMHASATTAYQSSLLADEVLPAITDDDDPEDNELVDRVIQARLYTGNAFSLRQGARLTSSAANAVSLEGLATGPAKGGTPVKLYAGEGGLAWVDRVEMVPAAKFFFGTPDPIATTFLPEPGTDEYVLEFVTPGVTQAGLYHMVIYLKSDPDQAAAVLTNAFEFTGEGISTGPCFIATAAYGTPMADDINVLRSVRDRYMLSNAVGAAFVDTYYHFSPPVADYIAERPWLATMVRGVLTPVVWLSRIALAMPGVTLLLLAATSFLLLRRRIRRLA